jgi:hypothetical protein
MGRKRVQGAKRVTVDGITFDSKREAARWSELKLLERAGKITDLRRQVPFPLFGRDDPILTPTGRKMKYIADFVYYDPFLKAEVVEDAKGWATDVYKIKKAILQAQGVEVREV